jgi:hypothetical protein
MNISSATIKANSKNKNNNGFHFNLLFDASHFGESSTIGATYINIQNSILAAVRFIEPADKICVNLRERLQYFKPIQSASVISRRFSQITALIFADFFYSQDALFHSYAETRAARLYNCFTQAKHRICVAFWVRYDARMHDSRHAIGPLYGRP